MIKYITLLILVLNVAILAAQDCMPVELPTDTSIIVPEPYDEATMTGGLTAACVNLEYSQVLTLKIPETVPFGGIDIAIDSASIETEGAFIGLPTGIDYSCNPPSCIFIANETGCIALFGNPDNTNMPGQYELSLAITAYSIVPLTINYPDDIPDVNGSYFIDVFEEGSSECLVSNENILRKEFNVSNQPNPFSDYTEIRLESITNKEVEFYIINSVGEKIQSQILNVQEGMNVITFDGSGLPAGMYAYIVSDGQNIIGDKMLLIK